MEVGVTGHHFESWPPKDHSCHVCCKLTYWFQRRLLNIFSIGSFDKTKSSHGGHLEFPIGKRITSLVQDHPMIIPAKSQFNWLGGFWQEDFKNFSQSEHVIGPGSHVEFPIYTKKHISGRGPSNNHAWQVWLKSVQQFQRRRVKREKLSDGRTDGRTTDAYPWQKLTWPMARWAKKN
jgi:hypothetical protein